MRATITQRLSLLNHIGALVCTLVLMGHAASAQTTSFSYKGQLTDSGLPANGSYAMQFKLFDALADGNQIGPTLRFEGDGSNPPVKVLDGSYTVQLDFGAEAFPGADRYLQVEVKYPSDVTFTPLGPRQQLTSRPYAIRSLSAATADIATDAQRLGSTEASKYVQTEDPRLSNERNPTSDSTYYIRNATSLQSASNFNISGNGKVGGTLSSKTVNAATQYSLDDQRVLSAPGSSNLFAGIAAGNSSTPGTNNSFVGAGAGPNNTGSFNSFFGSRTGRVTSGSYNSFFGERAGQNNTSGAGNSFVGWRAGENNTTGFSNSFVGAGAGITNRTGNTNSFFGTEAGMNNFSGRSNSFFGWRAGQNNSTGINLTIIGSNADASDGLDYATAIGANAHVKTSDTIVLGKLAAKYGDIERPADTVKVPGDLNVLGTFTGETISGNVVNAATQYKLGGQRVLSAEYDNVFVGIGAGQRNTTGSSNSFVGERSGMNNTSGSGNSFVGARTGQINTSGTNNTLIGSSAEAVGGLDHATAVGAGSTVLSSNTVVLGRNADTVRVPGTFVSSGTINVMTLGGGGVTTLCRNALTQIANCSSSLRYKTNIATFSSGLNLVSRLRPISFDWKAGGLRDVGFGAEEVAAINPLFVSYNSKGQVEGVKYDRLSVAFVNAFKEQQTQIEQQRNQIRTQQNQLDALRKLVCLDHPNADVCK